MLPKNRRIERKNFQYILKNGKRLNSKSFTLYLAKIEQNKDFLDTRVSFSVSKKVSKTAVNRNKLRRRGYSIINKHYKSIRKGYYCFFVYKKEYEFDFMALEREILGLLSSSLVLV